VSAALLISLFVSLAGLAALSWQVLWQLDLALCLGVSAKGAALTLATVMAGMSSGAWVASRFWSKAIVQGVLCSVWPLGDRHWNRELAPKALAPLIQSLDSVVYATAPSLTTPFSTLALTLSLGPATCLMGATFPVIGSIAHAVGSSCPVSTVWRPFDLRWAR